MSVILEFTIDADAFALGTVLSGPPDMRLELERIVPTGTMIMPFVWVTGADFDTFEKNVQASHYVKELRVLDKVGNSGLYRVDWSIRHEDDLIEGIAQANATVLEARGNGTWVFRLRFSNHADLSLFYNYCTAHNLSFHIERTYTLGEETERGREFNLSEKQREALVLALRRGYFATPREVTLAEVAVELCLSRQALSDRIRRGNEKILRSVLISSVTDFD